MKTIFYIGSALIALSLFSCRGQFPFDELEAVDGVVLDTGMFNPDIPSVTGFIVTSGDGIKLYGHVWTPGEQDEPPIMATNSTSMDSLDGPGAYVSNLSGVAEGVYFVRPYARDVHDRLIYGESQEIVIGNEVFASFTIENNNCTVPCTITFKNTSSTNATAFEWYVNDSLRSTSRDFELPSEIADTFSIQLIAKGEIGSPASSSDIAVFNALTFRKTANEFANNLGDGLEEGIGIVQLPDGGYIIAGNTDDGAVFLLQTDRNGNPDGFEKVIFQYSEKDVARDFIRLDNGDLVIVGTTENAQEDKRILFVRTNSNGVLQKDHTSLELDEDLPDSEREIYSAYEKSDGQIVMLGRLFNDSAGNNDILLISRNADLDSRGFPDRLIATSPGNTTIEIGQEIAFTGDGYILVGGQVNGFNKNIVTLKTDLMGEVTAGPFLNGGNGIENPFAIQEDKLNTGEYIICATSDSADPFKNILMIRTDGNGEPTDSLQLNDTESVGGMVVLNDGTMLLAGFRNNNAYITKLFNDWSIDWEKELTINGTESFNSIVPTFDGGFILTGRNNSKLFIVKTNAFGESP